jgi:hypothetical protein
MSDQADEATPAEQVESHTQNIRSYAQDLLDNGHLFGGQVGSVMAILRGPRGDRVARVLLRHWLEASSLHWLARFIP